MYELHRRFLRAGGEHYTPRKRLPGGKTDLIGSESALSTDLLGMNDDWPMGNQQRRDEIIRETKRFTMGLMWFFANDEAVPVRNLHLVASHGQRLTDWTCRRNTAQNGPNSVTVAMSSQTMDTFRTSSTSAMDVACFPTTSSQNIQQHVKATAAYHRSTTPSLLHIGRPTRIAYDVSCVTARCITKASSSKTGITGGLSA